MARKRPSLAIGNVVGSSISNILGAFSLGLIFRKNTNNDSALFATSSTIYSVMLLLVTAIASALLAFGHRIDWVAAGGSFIALFAIYIISISYLIAKGFAKAPEDMSDTSSDSDDTDEDANVVATEADWEREGQILLNPSGTDMALSPVEAGVVDGDSILAASKGRLVTGPGVDVGLSNEVENSLPSNLNGTSEFDEPSALSTQTPQRGHTEEDANTSRHGQHSLSRQSSPNTRPIHDPPHAIALGPKRLQSLTHHVVRIAVGFVGVVLSGYVLSNAASNLVDQLGISDVLAGVVILSIATTIPEKFVAVLSGHKGHMDIMLANTVGSNLFLLTLCIGIVWVATGGSYEDGDVVPAEIAVMFGSTVILVMTVVLQGRFARLIGVALLIGYIIFIVLEFIVIHKV